MYRVNTNKYSHEGSGFSIVDSEHNSLEQAIEAAQKLWDRGFQRFVFVTDKDGKEVWTPNGRK